MTTNFLSPAYAKANTANDDALVQQAFDDVLSARISTEMFDESSAAFKALQMVGGNTGKFAQNYVQNNKDKVDPMLTKRLEMQEGGEVPEIIDSMRNLPPEVVASDVINGAPVGMVDVPNGGGPVDDGVPTELPEGTFVLNAAAIQYHGTETIDKLISDAVRALLKEGVQISAEDPNPDDDVPVAISNGEYVIPPEVAEKIGYKKLEDMNERGLEYRKKQEEAQKKQAEAEAKQQPPPQPPQQPQETFMGLQMPPEQAGPPQAPVQSEQQAEAMVMPGMGMLSGGRVPLNEGTAQGGLSRARDAFINWFNDTYLGGNPDPVVITPTKPPVVNPAQEGMLQQGGFVENYTYAQPQQTTLGTPFPNAVTSNPQQYSSFVQPNKQRVNAEEGKEIVRPDLPPMTTDNISVSSQIQNTLNSMRVGLPDDDPKALELDSIIKNYQENRIIPQGYGFIEKYKDYIYPVVPDKEPSPSIEPAPEKTPAPIVPLRSNDRTAANGGFIN